MLLAVKGGGFFSSSVSGYTKGLTLLALGKKPMRVAPWNQYQLVDQESDPDLQLASSKSRLVRGCAPFLCFGCAAAGHESPSLGPTQNHKGSFDSEKVKEKAGNLGAVNDDDNVNSVNGSCLRSSLKRPATSVFVNIECQNDNGRTERRVQWTDVSGGELFVVREFEPSEHSGSDDEFESRNKRSCSCRFM